MARGCRTAREAARSADPLRVVAPMSVNGRQFDLDTNGRRDPCRARCRSCSPPWPNRDTPRQSGLRRWISSMKSTSPGFEVRQQARQIARLVQNGAGGDFELGVHLVGDDVRQCGLAQSGRTVQQYVVERIAAHEGRLDRRCAGFRRSSPVRRNSATPAGGFYFRIRDRSLCFGS